MITSVTTGYNLYLLVKSLRINLLFRVLITKNMYNTLVLRVFIGIDSMKSTKEFKLLFPKLCSNCNISYLNQ